MWLLLLALALAVVLLWNTDAIKVRFQSASPAQVVQASAPVASGPRASGVVTVEAPVQSITTTSQTSTPQWHIVQKGESLIGIAKQYGLDWRLLCLHNRLSNCHDIKPDESLNLVIDDATKVLFKKAPRTVFQVKNHYVVTDCALTKLGYCVFSRPGGDPVCRRDQVDILSRDFSISKDVAKGWAEVAKEEGVISAGTMIDGLSFGRGYWKGPVKVMQTMTYKKGEIGGQTVGQFDACCNYFPMKPPTKLVEPPPAPPEAPLPPEVPASAPQAPSSPPATPPESPEVVKTARDYDFDAIVYVGIDKDVAFSGLDVAGYPWIHQTKWGRYAVGFGGSASLWKGETPDGFRFKGALPTFGLAQKLSFPSRRDIGMKLVYGDLWTRGEDGSGRYKQKAHARLICGSLAFTDASREKEGATWFPEYSLSASYCDPFSQTKSHSYDGKALDQAALSDIKYVAGASVQVIIRKNLGETGIGSKLQPLVELGVNQTAPNPVSGHLYVGVRTVNKVWTLGVGHHWSSLGETPGATLVYNAGLDYKLTVQEERWNEMIQSLEALGVGTD